MSSNSTVLAAIRMVVSKMSTEELVAFYMAATMGAVPPQNIGYEAGKSLLTEANGTRVHAEGLQALDIVVGERLDEEKTNEHGRR